MSLRYRIIEDAKQELLAAASYHEEQRPGLGLKLFDEYDAVIEHARAFPTAGRPVTIEAPFELRCYQMRRFRYAIFAALVDKALVVVGVSHHKREPGYWAQRIATLR